MDGQAMMAQMFGYHEWASLALIDHCSTVPAEVLSIPIPDGVGTIRETFGHMVWAEWWGLSQFPDAMGLDAPGQEMSLSWLRERITAHAEAWQRALRDVEDFDLAGGQGIPSAKHAGTMLALQALHHGELHRTDVRGALNVFGHPVPGRDETDVWAYWMARGLASETE